MKVNCSLLNLKWAKFPAHLEYIEGRFPKQAFWFLTSTLQLISCVSLCKYLNLYICASVFSVRIIMTIIYLGFWEGEMCSYISGTWNSTRNGATAQLLLSVSLYGHHHHFCIFSHVKHSPWRLNKLHQYATCISFTPNVYLIFDEIPLTESHAWKLIHLEMWCMAPLPQILLLTCISF